MVWKEIKETFLVYLMDIDTSLKEKAPVCNTCVDWGTHECIKSEVPAPEEARLQAHMGSIFH